MMVIVMKNDGGVFDYIFLMIQFMWGYTRLWVYWFFQFSSREWRRWRPGAYAARVQITKTHPILSPFTCILHIHCLPFWPLLSLFSLFHHSLSSPTSPPYFRHSSSRFSLHFFYLSPSSPCSPASPPLSSHFCPLQRPSLARQGWLQIRSSVPWG